MANEAGLAPTRRRSHAHEMQAGCAINASHSTDRSTGVVMKLFARIAALVVAVGGSMILYAGDWPRMPPSDFRVRTLDGVADDWPLTYEELEPFYDRIAREVGESGLAGDPAYPEGEDLPLPALPLATPFLELRQHVAMLLALGVEHRGAQIIVALFQR